MKTLESPLITYLTIGFFSLLAAGSCFWSVEVWRPFQTRTTVS